MSLATTVVSILLNGLQQGSIYVLLAVGLSIILGTLEFVNFAHGALYIVGAYFGLYVAGTLTLSEGYLSSWGFSSLGLEAGFLLALVAVIVVVFLLGLLMERFVTRAFYDRPDTDQILVTFGLAIVVQESLRLLFGSSSQSFAQPIQGSVPIEGVATTWWRIAVIGITAVLVLGVYLLIEYTDFGLVVRAGTEDAEMVRLLGIRITRPYVVVFGIGAALAGVAGVVGGPLNPINPTAGTDILVPAFVTVVIGGVGSIRGAVLGGVTLGLIQSFFIQTSIGTYNLAPWAQVAIYAMAAVILLWRPQGIMGEEVSTA
ncbi:branched-chain amino acid ABC transporter permease [Haloarchaeobius amylolyticus]|uniref:branched-chain amino acid ABC transporter permease n=1 Tax=Haloarchaeobius amylolyticus TaxID=1198296 RepID=UPI00226F68F5|nr:branched-chain amino acid ABC transporter permease [Haloarchaeobius amylolyticus]